MNKIRSIIKQIKTNFKYISKKAFEGTCSIIASFQLVSFLCDLGDIFPETLSFWVRLVLSAAIVSVIWCFAFLIQSIFILNNKRVTVISVGNKHVYVEYGNLLKETGFPQHIVVPANRCFDTIVDNDLICKSSVHGQAINKICSTGVTAEMLNTSLQKNLKEVQKLVPTSSLLKRKKRKGNRERYPVGTIAEYQSDPPNNLSYFFLAMSSLNEKLHAKTSDYEYIVALQSLIEHFNERSQQIPVYLPIIGSNGRDTRKSDRELLEFMVSILRFNSHLINTDIHIVVYENNRDSVSIYGL